MEECLRAEVERVVYTSSAAALGPAAAGKAATEKQPFTGARLGIPYVDSVHEAEAEAMRLAAEGLPVVCVNPSMCLGAGDHLLSSTRLVRSFLLGRIPIYTDGAVGIVDVRDAAAGHLLAELGGKVGERYLLSGRNFTFERLFADLGRLSGVPTPVRIPPRRRRGGGSRPGPARPLVAAHAGGGACRRAQLDVPVHQGAARARLAGAPARGDARGDRGLASRARARADRAHAQLAGRAVPAGGRGARRRGRRSLGLARRTVRLP